MKMCEVMNDMVKSLTQLFCVIITIMSNTELVTKYIQGQPQTRVKCSQKFVIQIDDSAHVAVLAQLFQFVRHYFEENIK
jgi:hypothetical protein